jgi:uncharacterized protein (DUF1501 family)
MNLDSAFRSLSRRGVLRLAAGGAAGLASGSWLSALAQQTPPTRRRHKSCILLFMHGGPSHIDTFDPKPDAPAEIRGSFRPINTAVPGIQVSEVFPRFAEQTRNAAIIRGMSTGDRGHLGARYLMHTGYPFQTPRVDGKTYPDLGAVVAKELGDPRSIAPNYVFLYSESGSAQDVYGPGFLGPEYRPLVVQDPNRGVENLESPLNAEQFRERLELLDHVQSGFQEAYRAEAIRVQRSNLQRAVGLMQSDVARAFDLRREPAASAEPYGSSRFGRQCLMARRLIEVGVPFVEVSSSSWDHHANITNLMRRQGGELDVGMAALIRDLRTRGLLDDTLIVCMGEFGRTPRMRGDGRDHYAQAWSTVLTGGGLRGGQVIGRTDREGATVEARPVSASDFFATVFRILGIDPSREHQASGGRPIRIVREGARPINELLG